MDAVSLDTNSRVYRRAIYLTLHDVKSHLVSNEQTLHTYFESLPQFSDYSDVETAVDVDDRNRNRLIENETSYKSTTLDHQAAALNSLNADQKRVYDKVMEAVHPAGPDASVLGFSPGKQFFWMDQGVLENHSCWKRFLQAFGGREESLLLSPGVELLPSCLLAGVPHTRPSDSRWIQMKLQQAILVSYDQKLPCSNKPA
ncbi:hypothetical protein PI125_g5326 [Phytophthora idaei]|nr:hypothetical protein PI125_g5326 [Phytophthora idaei]